MSKSSLFKAVAVERNGEKYMNVTAMEGTLHIKKVHFNATGIVPDPALNELILEFVNQNIQYAKHAVAFDTKHLWDKLVMHMFHGILSRIPIKRIFT